ncbi:hypothetical protein ACJX0J_040136, partial [Zea mays]
MILVCMIPIVDGDLSRGGIFDQSTTGQYRSSRAEEFLDSEFIEESKNTWTQIIILVWALLGDNILPLIKILISMPVVPTHMGLNLEKRKYAPLEYLPILRLLIGALCGQDDKQGHVGDTCHFPRNISKNNKNEYIMGLSIWMGAWPYIHILKRMRPDMLFPPVGYALRSNSLNVYLNMDIPGTMPSGGGQEGQPAQGDSYRELLDSPLWDLVIPGVAPDVESTILSIHPYLDRHNQHTCAIIYFSLVQLLGVDMKGKHAIK